MYAETEKITPRPTGTGIILPNTEEITRRIEKSIPRFPNHGWDTQTTFLDIKIMVDQKSMPSIGKSTPGSRDGHRENYAEYRDNLVEYQENHAEYQGKVCHTNQKLILTLATFRTRDLHSVQGDHGRVI
jgi:hypothetical protein